MTRTGNRSVLRSLGVASITVTLLLAATPIAGAEEHATGLDRAREAAAVGREHARSNAAVADLEDRGRGSNDAETRERSRGLERASEAVLKAMDRKQGAGHGFGRGHAAEVHEILLAGGSPSSLEPHGTSVSDAVHAFNEMRKRHEG